MGVVQVREADAVWQKEVDAERQAHAGTRAQLSQLHQELEEHRRQASAQKPFFAGAHITACLETQHCSIGATRHCNTGYMQTLWCAVGLNWWERCRSAC